jgi:23S rRNA (uracil1939-C5)-methyltransferase
MTPMALPGELVRIDIESDKPSLIRARVAEVLEPSPERVAPRCAHFGRCGGCQYQHAGYAYQVAQKVEIVREVLRRVGHIEIDGEIPTVTAEPWAYRNRVQLHFDDRRMGFHAAGSHDLEPILSCDVASPRLAEAIKTLRDMKRSPRWPRFIRSLELFTNETEVQVNVLDSGTQHVNRGFFQWIGEAMPGAMEPALTYHAAGFDFRVSHKSFFQINRLLLERLAEVALAGASGETAIDLYAGVGLFSLPLARRFPSVTAVEAVTAASGDLVFNANRHGLAIAAVKSRTEEFLASVQEAPDFMLADPPRMGLGKEAVESLVKIGSPRLHLVSCDPPTLARDLAGLVAGGYRVEGVTVVDLFPQTSHIETVTRLLRSS